MGTGVNIEPSWRTLLAAEFDKDYFVALTDFVRREYASTTIYPAGRNIFRAFDKCPVEQVKVVIIGQDPYHNVGQANGLCFSVGDGVDFPPSLRNIFKELADDMGIASPKSGNLDAWAERGVLLLNSTLTVRAHQANSHAGAGWEKFTDAVVAALNQTQRQIVYILWGAYAQKKGAIVDASKNCIIKSVHPSPLSAYGGFFGSKPFSKTNDYLLSVGKEAIDWSL